MLAYFSDMKYLKTGLIMDYSPPMNINKSLTKSKLCFPQPFQSKKKKKKKSKPQPVIVTVLCRRFANI